MISVKQIGLLVQWNCDNPNCERVVMVPIVSLRNALPGRKIFCVGNSMHNNDGSKYCTNWVTPEEILMALDGANYKPRTDLNQALPLGDR